MILVFLAIFGILGCTSPGNGPGAENDMVVDKGGGTVSAQNGSVELDFPKGALDEKTTISVKRASQYPQSGDLIPDTIYELGPDGTSFEEAVQLSIRYDPSKIPAGVSEGDLMIAKAMDWMGMEGWSVFPNSTVDEGENTVTAPIGGFSTYGITARGSPAMSDEFVEWMNNPPYELSGDVTVNPQPSIICLPGGELYVEAVYTDAQGYTYGYDDQSRDDKPLFLWQLDSGGTIHHGEESNYPDLWANPGFWIPSKGVIILRSPDTQEGKKGKLRVRVAMGGSGFGKIVAEIEMPVEFTEATTLTPKPAQCPSGSMVQLECRSPYNFIHPFSEDVRFDWRTTGAFGKLSGEGRRIVYEADGDAQPGASDTVTVSVYLDGELVGEDDTLVLISEGLTLEPYPDFLVDPGQRKLIKCRFSGESPQGELRYQWGCSETCGTLWYPDEKDNSVWYRGNDDALDYQTDNVTVEVFLVQNGERTSLGRAETRVEIYNPTRIYNFCGDPSGEKWPKGGTQWEFYLVGQGLVGGGFKARPGESIRVRCIKAGADPGDLYIRLGRVGDGPTSETQLLLAASQIHDELDETFTIEIA